MKTDCQLSFPHPQTSLTDPLLQSALRGLFILFYFTLLFKQIKSVSLG